MEGRLNRRIDPDGRGRRGRVEEDSDHRRTPAGPVGKGPVIAGPLTYTDDRSHAQFKDLRAAEVAADRARRAILGLRIKEALTVVKTYEGVSIEFSTGAARTPVRGSIYMDG